MPETSAAVQISQTFDRFQRSVATEAVLTERITRETAELDEMNRKFIDGLNQLGYVPATHGDPVEFLSSICKNAETALAGIEAAVR